MYCEAVYITVDIKSNSQLQILDMCTHRVQTEWGFDEVFAILSGTIKYLEKHFLWGSNGYVHHKIIFFPDNNSVVIHRTKLLKSRSSVT